MIEREKVWVIEGERGRESKKERERERETEREKNRFRREVIGGRERLE